MMTGPTDQEQLLLEYTNESRLDPMADAARYISSYTPLISSDAAIQNALNYFGVSGSALQTALAGLAPVQPLAWNGNLAISSETHNQAMIAADTQSHQVAGEASLGDRVASAGYANWNLAAENIYAYSSSPLYAQAGFIVDWGPGASGMQDPAGHRVDIMNGSYNEVGIAIDADTHSATLGPQVVTEDFGLRFGSASFVTGVAYNDSDGNDFYSLGEGRGDLVVSDSTGSVTSYASGGYSLLKSSAAETVTLGGGGLTGAVTVGIPAGTVNEKFDVVSGHELKVTGTVTVSGPVDQIEGVGFNVNITANDSLARTIFGTAHDDMLSATSGSTVIQGGAGSDTIVGGSGNDHIYGGSPNGGVDGADLITTGDGNNYVQGNAGNDTIYAGNGVDRINGGADNDMIYAGSGVDSVNGNAGNDTIHAGGGSDYLRGGQGDDMIYGGAGNDILMGDLGNDTLTAGTGSAIITGGLGSDVFVFPSGNAPFSAAATALIDAITDFTHGDDHLSLGFSVGAVLHGTAADVATAAQAAQTLLSPTSHDVAAFQVGQDTYLFYGAGGGAAVDSAIKLATITGATVATSDFV